MLKIPYVDWIWRARGSIDLDPPRSPDNAFAKLNTLLDDNGTSHEVTGNTLSYVKDNPAAQDKLATFSRGKLTVVEEDGRSKLKYDLTSPALLLVFLAPLLFLTIAQGTVLISVLEAPTEEEKAEAEAEKAKEEEEAEEPQPLNIVDQMLGAPAPETLEEKRIREEAEEAEKEEEEGTHSPTSAYVFAGLFGALFFVGRMLEPWLFRRNMRRVLNAPSASTESDAGEQPKPQHPG